MLRIIGQVCLFTVGVEPTDSGVASPQRATTFCFCSLLNSSRFSLGLNPVDLRLILQRSDQQWDPGQAADTTATGRLRSSRSQFPAQFLPQTIGRKAAGAGGEAQEFNYTIRAQNV